MHRAERFRASPLRCLAVVWMVLATSFGGPSAAADSKALAPVNLQGTPLPIDELLGRLLQGARDRSFSGVFVVSSGGQMDSARIWHVSSGEQQIELVESLTGAPRSVYRHNTDVLTFLPQSRLALRQEGKSSIHFTAFLRDAGSRLAEVYRAQSMGQDRVAGFAADVTQLLPKDRLRFGYRVWTEAKSGLVLKRQTLAGDGRVLEQAAFTEVQLAPLLTQRQLLRMMGQTEGYRVERMALARAPRPDEGAWMLKKAVPGFRLVSRVHRSFFNPAQTGQALQWTFTDGLANVSVFMEPFDAVRHGAEGSLSAGLTQTLTRRLGNDWVTAMGEVPLGTLKLFVASLERKR